MKPKRRGRETFQDRIKVQARPGRAMQAEAGLGWARQGEAGRGEQMGH